LYGPAVFTVTAIPGAAAPEPDTLALLLCGLFALGLAGAASKKARVQALSPASDPR
jgi:hypothetical protein